jgi:hypothetical protein
MIKKFITFVVVLLILLGCSKQQVPTPKQQGENYFPEGSKGTKWEYLLRITSPSGTQDGRLSISIDGEETINGKKYYKQTSLMSFKQGSKPQVNYNRRTIEGIYRLDARSADKKEYLMIPFPLTVGRKWTTQSSNSHLESVAEKIESIEFLGKTYKNCLKISFKGDANTKPLQGYSYFTPDIGETVTEVRVGDVTILYVLDKYNI